MFISGVILVVGCGLYLWHNIPTELKESVQNRFCALALYEEGKYKEAMEIYDKLIEANPEDISANKGKGRAFHKLEKYEQAIECYNKALKCIDKNTLNGNPQSCSLWVDIGLSYIEIGNYEEAINSFNKALEIDPDFIAAKEGKEKALKAINN